MNLENIYMMISEKKKDHIMNIIYEQFLFLFFDNIKSIFNNVDNFYFIFHMNINNWVNNKCFSGKFMMLEI